MKDVADGRLARMRAGNGVRTSWRIVVEGGKEGRTFVWTVCRLRGYWFPAENEDGQRARNMVEVGAQAPARGLGGSGSEMSGSKQNRTGKRREDEREVEDCGESLQ